MFRLIPLRSVTRTSRMRIDEVAPFDYFNYDAVQRVIQAPDTNVPSPSASRSWEMSHENANSVMVAHGELRLDLYCLNSRQREDFIITPENVYKNGRIYYGSPAMIHWRAGTYYKTHSGEDGCIFTNFIQGHSHLMPELIEMEQPTGVPQQFGGRVPSESKAA